MDNATSPLDFASPYTMYDMPFAVWQLYVEHLWNWHPDSWVGSIAYASRLLAFVLLFPFVVLTGLVCANVTVVISSPKTFQQDVASYVIARTLGVVDDVKASTTDHATRNPPTIRIHDASPQMTDPYASSSSELELSSSPESFAAPHTLKMSTLDGASSGGSPFDANPLRDAEGLPSLDVSDPHPYFASEENSLKLSGVGVFSPAGSRPPSPTLTRRHILPEGRSQIPNPDSIANVIGGGRQMLDGDDEGLIFRARARRTDRDE